MDLNQFSQINIEIVQPASPSPNVRASVSFIDPKTNVESAWNSLKAEIMSHPQLAGATVAQENVSGTLMPRRGLTAQLVLKRDAKPAPATPAPAPAQA